MKKISFLIIVLFSFESLALGPNSILVELGEDYKLKNVHEKIWIENPKVIKVDGSMGHVVKPVAIGSSKLRVDQILKTVYVVPVGFKESFAVWEKLAFQFASLHADLCDNTACLSGSIHSLNEFQKIIRLMKQNGASLFFNLKMNEALKPEIRKWYSEHFRENNLTPLKIVFSSPWKVFIQPKEDSAIIKDVLQKVGLLAIESKQKIDIADNIRVEIQVTEIKKDFIRKMGLKWPSEYSAQVVNFESDGFEPFNVNLQAYEKTGDMKILASPNLLSRSGKEATFFAGGEFPIKIVSYRQQDITWKKYGIQMKIKPVIDSIGQMSLELECEVSSLDQSKAVDGIPTIHIHKVASHFDLIESKTIALSGLIRNEQGESQEGLPYLTQIPLIGKLFSSQDFLESRSELVIFVTPKLMEP